MSAQIFATFFLNSSKIQIERDFDLNDSHDSALASALVRSARDKIEMIESSTFTTDENSMLLMFIFPIKSVD